MHRDTPVSALGVISGLYRSKESYRAAIDQAARAFVTLAASRKPPKPRFYDLVFFRAMRMKAEANPYDRAYWEERGWLKSDYYESVPLNPFSLLAAKAVEATMRANAKATGKPDEKTAGS